MTIPLHLKRFLIAFAAVAFVAAGYFSTSVPSAKALTSLNDVAPGSLIRGQSLPAVYYMGADGLRYVFTNDKNYFTWYTNFNSVLTISDTDLQKIQMGGNVTYRPGVKMIKITSDSKTYAISKGGTLRHITSESVATSLYGSTWNKQIDDVADVFFTNYKVGSPINSAGDYSVEGEKSASPNIGADKGLVAPKEISITSTGYSPIDVTIAPGQGVRFTNNDSQKHTATSDLATWGTGTLNPGDSYIATFKEAGTYGFFDSYNSARTGAVYVQ